MALNVAELTQSADPWSTKLRQQLSANGHNYCVFKVTFKRSSKALDPLGCFLNTFSRNSIVSGSFLSSPDLATANENHIHSTYLYPAAAMSAPPNHCDKVS
jgi:hypothetical protein